MFFSACPKFCRSSAAIRSTPGALFAFRPLNAFSNSSFKIESPLSSFCTSLSFFMRSATTSPLYRLSMYSIHLLTLSLLSVYAFLFSSLTQSIAFIYYTLRKIKFSKKMVSKFDDIVHRNFIHQSRFSYLSFSPCWFSIFRKIISLIFEKYLILSYRY